MTVPIGRAITVVMMIVVVSTIGMAVDMIIGRASVIDGDTIEIHGHRIRLWGIDAPESCQTCPKGGTDWRCGQQAALALDAHLAGHTVACAPLAPSRRLWPGGGEMYR